jgi:hypothetical protein
MPCRLPTRIHTYVIEEVQSKQLSPTEILVPCHQTAQGIPTKNPLASLRISTTFAIMTNLEFKHATISMKVTVCLFFSSFNGFSQFMNQLKTP